MNKLLIGITLLFLSNNCLAQKAYNFSLNWKLGDKKIVASTFETIKYNKDTVTSRSLDSSQFELRVLAENETDYTIELRYPNIAFDDFRIDKGDFDAKFKKQNDIRLEYQVNKKTGQAELTKWIQAQQNIKSGLEKISDAINKTEDDTSTAAALLKMYVGMFDTKKKIESYVDMDLFDLLLPFTQEFKLNERISSIDSGASPFNKQQQISIENNMTLNNINEPTSTAQIDVELIFDMSSFKQMLVDMMQKFAKMMDADGKSSEKAKKEIEEVDIHTKQNIAYNFNYKSGWMQTVRKKHLVYGYEPRKGNYKTVINVAIDVK